MGTRKNPDHGPVESTPTAPSVPTDERQSGNGKRKETQHQTPPPLPNSTEDKSGTKLQSVRQAFAAIDPATSRAEQSSNQYRRREAFLEAWRETPSWLTSLVVHLTILITLGSLMRPNTPHPGVNLLVLSTAVDPSPSEGDLVIFAMDDTRSNGGDAGSLKEPTHLNDVVESIVPDDAVVKAPDLEPSPKLRIGLDAEMFAEFNEETPVEQNQQSEAESPTNEDFDASNVDGSTRMSWSPPSATTS